MSTPSVVFSEQLGHARVTAHAPPDESQRSVSAVSWAAVFAGASASAALSLILLILGTGLGLASVSPWAQNGISAATFGVTTIVWVTFTQIAASGLGGYLAGRLRTKWVAVHTDEVYFRDTAHGFLSWATASLATAALLASVIGSIIGGGVQAGAAVAGGAAQGATLAATTTASIGAAEMSKTGTDSSSMSYFIDSMFRKDPGNGATMGNPAIEAGGSASSASSGAEVARIFVSGLRNSSMPADDSRYVAQMISLRTGLSQADAEKRVSSTFARAQTALRDAEVSANAAADKARKASSYAALWLFVSLLIGAFAASLAATSGGRQRDK